MDLCVRANLRGNGIGSRLLKHLKKILKEMEVTAIYLMTLEGGRAQSFYETNGYRVRSEDIALWPKLFMVREL